MEEKLNKWCTGGGRVLTADPILEAGISKYSVSFWLEHFQTQFPGFENERQGRKRQFLLLKVKTLPGCAGDLFYCS